MIPRFIVYTLLALALLYWLVTPSTFWTIVLIASGWSFCVGLIVLFIHGASLLRGNDND